MKKLPLDVRAIFLSFDADEPDALLHSGEYLNFPPLLKRMASVYVDG